MRRICFSMILATLLVVLCQVPCNGTQTSGSPYALVDPLFSAHLIFRGEIVSLGGDRSTFDAWGIVTSHKAEIVVDQIGLRVDEVIRGKSPGAMVEVAAFGYLHGSNRAPFEVGDEVIIATYFNPVAQRFQLRTYSGLFVRRGDQWLRPDASVYRLRVDAPSMTLAEIVSRVSLTSPRSVAARAEVVVVGLIASADSDLVRAGGSVETCWTLEVSDILKGEFGSGKIKFCMPTKGFFPEWAVPTPQRIRLGEKWIVFLAKRDGSWVPFAGVNGMLKVDSNKVVYDGVVDYGVKWVDLKAVVESIDE